jgi:hypothetical protein
MKTGLKVKQLMSGHILVATLVVAGVLGIALAAYLNVLHTQNNLTVRSQVWNACMPIVEAGIEEALAHVNSTTTTTNWELNGWVRDKTANSFSKTNTIGAGFFTCTISTNAGPNPVITCTGKLPAPITVGTGRNPLVAVAGGGNPPATVYISRTVQVKTTKPPALIKGLMAKMTIDFSGNNVGTDSYNSALGPYGGVNISDKGDVAVNGDIINIGNANVNGHVGAGPKAKVQVGPNGFVGSIAWTATHKGKEPGWVRNDMNVELPDVQPPWPAGTAGAPGTSGSYKYLLDAQNYELDSLTIGSGDSVVVTNGVATLWVKGNVDIQGAIKVSQPGTLRLYVGGSVSLSGTWDKSALPADLMIYGLPTCTSVNVTTGSKLEAVIYAPQASLTLNGTANLFGSATAKSVKLTGNSMFHYDEALGSLAPSIFTITSWKEM